MHIAIVEDDGAIRTCLKDIIDVWAAELEKTVRVDGFADGDEILEDYRADYDLIFLDIQMARVDGMKTAQAIRERDESVHLVFVTNLAGYAIRGYGVRALDFVLKPVNPLTIRQILTRVDRLMAAREKRYLTLPTDKGLVRLDVSQIDYIETQGHMLVIHSREGEYRKRESMKNMMVTLTGEPFERCNNCYLVNLAHVRRVEKGLVWVGESELAISRPRQKAFMDALTRYIGGGRLL